VVLDEEIYGHAVADADRDERTCVVRLMLNDRRAKGIARALLPLAFRYRMSCVHLRLLSSLAQEEMRVRGARCLCWIFAFLPCLQGFQMGVLLGRYAQKNAHEDAATRFPTTS
jgi:hypothetical protein